MVVEKGNTVLVEYEGRLEDGEVFDSSKDKDPLKFEVGSGNVIRGFDEGVLGMEKGEEKEIVVNPKDAYGEINEQLYKKIPKSSFSFDQDPEKGMGLMINTPDGEQFPTKIVDVNSDNITIDLNHPLAGKKLIFNVKVLDVK